MGRAGKLLAQRPRSEREVRDRLERAGLEHDAIDGAVARLKELDLLDDSAFARQWVAERSKKRGRAALVMELTSKGIERDVVEAALGEVAADEEARAAEVAATALRKVAACPRPRRPPASSRCCSGEVSRWTSPWMRSRRCCRRRGGTERLAAPGRPRSWDCVCLSCHPRASDAPITGANRPTRLALRALRGAYH